MVTNVFNIQPVLFHLYYLSHLLWFKKRSFSLVIPNSATSLCFVDRVWKGIIDKCLLSRGGGSGGMGCLGIGLMPT